MKYVPYHRRGFFIRFNPVAVIGTFLVAVCRPGTNKISVLLLGGQGREYFSGDILAVNGVHDIFQRHDVGILGAFGGQRIKIVIDRDEPNVQERKHPLQIIARLPVVAAKAG